MTSEVSASHEEQLTRIVMQSFDKRPMPSGVYTAREITRRVEMMHDIWETLYNDSKWSQSRIIDHMLQFIVRRIDGEGLPAEATRAARDDESAMWSPETSREVEGERRLSALASKGDTSPRGES